MLRNCCKAILPILYNAQEPAAMTGRKTIINLISMNFFPCKFFLVIKLYYNLNSYSIVDYN